VKWLAAGALVALVVLGAIVLTDDLDGAWLLAIWVPLALIAVLRLILGSHAWARTAALVIGAVVVPVLALLGIDWLWPSRLDPLPSLVVGAILVAILAWIWLGPPFRDSTAHRGRGAVVVALALVVLPPVGVAAIGAFKGDERALSQPPQAVSKLDVIVLRAGGGAADTPASNPQGWAVRTWVGQVVGKRVRWGPEGPPPPGPEEDADRVLLLMVDGEPARLDRAPAQPPRRAARGEVQRWLHLADLASSPSTPTFALLRTKDQTRLKRWDAGLAGRPGDPSVRSGRALSLDELTGPRTTTDLALRLAVTSRTSDEDLALAAKYRPALFFDSSEAYPEPLNVDRILASGKMSLCDRGQALRTLCPAVHSSADLHNGADHLEFKPEDIAGVKADSTIYVNVTRSGNDARNAIYLDYWWYFPNNPAGAGGGALCGAGFVIAGLTCFDHQSDWEGVTIVLDGDAPGKPPLAVSYAQHDGVVRYTWPALQRLWDGGDRDRFGKRVKTGIRPLVFVANGTHASYPTSCAERHCRVGGVPGIPATRPIKEASHDGLKEWPPAEAASCPTFCLSALPTRNGGADAARWNAFSGFWGTKNCVLGIVCASSKPPQSPGLQDRYERPWCAQVIFDFASERFSRAAPRCTGRKPSADEIAKGERLLALGDSYSSGEGAGSYDPDTNASDNTCHRSPLAWSQRVARSMRLVPLPSLACSGAVTGDVLRGDRTSDEPERRISQVSRIAGDPGVVTLTIGGNDTGFATVLRDCVLGNCLTKYVKPSGDVLEGRIEKLAGELPGVYTAIRGAAPRARLVVMGYPRIFPDTRAGVATASNCAAFGTITTDEVAYLNDLTRKLNTAIAGAAEAAGADFVDVSEAFDGQELRCRGPSYMNRLTIVPRKLFKASFHPNARGYERLAALVAKKLAASGR
jgi:lysophospholipase L1-like esterase